MLVVNKFINWILELLKVLVFLIDKIKKICRFKKIIIIVYIYVLSLDKSLYL